MANLNSVLEVISLSQNKFQWIVEKKIDLLEDALHSGSLILNDLGECENKSVFLKNIVEGNFLFERIAVNKSTPKVQKGSAVIWGEGQFEMIKEGKSENKFWEFTEVYFKVDGFWKIMFISFNSH